MLHELEDIWITSDVAQMSRICVSLSDSGGMDQHHSLLVSRRGTTWATRVGVKLYTVCKTPHFV